MRVSLYKALNFFYCVSRIIGMEKLRTVRGVSKLTKNIFFVMVQPVKNRLKQLKMLKNLSLDKK